MSVLQNVSSLLGGAIFGTGLVVSGMTDPDNVLAFLTLGSTWDPALIFVMGSAVVIATTGYWLCGRRQAPLFAESYHSPQSQQIDSRLASGAVLFGLGWGITGFCPGPALVGLMTLDERAMLFIVAYVVGVLLFDVVVNPRVTATATGIDG